MLSNRQKRKRTNSSHQSTQPTPVPASSPSPVSVVTRSEGFTLKDFQYLAENENARYLNNSSTGKIGHAVIVKVEDGSKVAYQYPLPSGDGAPQVLLLSNIEEIHRFGMTRYKAHAPDNTPMYAKRFLQAKIKIGEKEEDVDIGYFSPAEKEGHEPFWGSGNTISILRQDLDEETKKDLEVELQETKGHTKGGEELVVDHESVRVRDENKKRTPDQNTVMSGSATEAYKDFFDCMTEELTPEAKDIFRRAIDAPLHHAFKSNYRPEWLHAEGFSLTPVTKDPQRKDNLGAAPKWANTEMMITERIAKWFALNRPESYVSIKPHFEMLFDSELIRHIKFEVRVQERERFVLFLQNIDPFRKWPLFRKASDLAQSAGITYNLLNGIDPISRQVIVNSRAVSSPSSTSRSLSTPLSSLSTPPPSALAQGANAGHAPIPPQGSPAHSGREGGLFSSSPVSTIKNKVKHKFPTHLKYEKSIVKTMTTSHEPNYDEPWLGTHVVGSSGTGLVIADGDKKYVLTNAHCVENAVIVRVRLANDNKKKYEAQVKSVSYQCDLALLEIKDPGFHSLVEPVQLGDMVDLRDKVQTVGFPMGGDEVSISQGIVSRIEVRDYCMSGLEMLQVQIDAAVNPGNSGGPVFSEDKVVGVAFQGYARQGLGYMIPIPIMKHFLREALSGQKYPKFPEVPMVYQSLRNPYLRQYYQMNDNQSGVRVVKVQNLSDAFTKIRTDDVLLEIDSMPISNDGKVDVPGIGRCIDMIHVMHMKYIGEQVRFKLLRKDEGTGIASIHDVSVVLDCAPLETEKVAQMEHDKMPTYFIASGIAFVPLTRNYMEGNGSEFEEYYSIESACSLTDIPKKKPNEEFVVINGILDCEETEGYQTYTNAVVKEVNGIKINNMLDVVRAFEANRQAVHHINVGNKVLAVPAMSKANHDQLLHRYHINFDRSEDLRGSQLEARTPLIRDASAENWTPFSSSPPPSSPSLPLPIVSLNANPRSNLKRPKEDVHSHPKRLKGHHGKRIVESDDEEDIDSSMAVSPGAKRFLDTIADIEERYRNQTEDDEDDISDLFDEDNISIESSTEPDEDESQGERKRSKQQEEKEEESQEDRVEKRPPLRRVKKFSFFNEKEQESNKTHSSIRKRLL